MSNIFGNKPLKITFEWYGETKTIELESKRIEASYSLNQEVSRIHTSVLNGAVIKEHLGFYHKIKAHFHGITTEEFEDIFRYISVVDEIKVYPFRDNTSFYFTAIINKDKAYPYEFDDISTLPDSYFLECESSIYSELLDKPVVGGFIREEEFFTAVDPCKGGFIREGLLDVV